ncbi:hypothetical protein D0T51_10260 [Parabacteroides sp. 52]|uniref:BF3164 family lipoprotein n=1 Tax=unclassified Parabacteroides TaxID=2649774 RepID=UPI0013CFCF48|nr:MULTISPECIES: BF3164 family lipoprotein [unclassified Parabacteroides]MDH6534696.1 hypothetical protein [Parabacteroides sp. PM5-20]NDV56108.1 hypothetical protein [Parabacteroides sp. 52]
MQYNLFTKAVPLIKWDSLLYSFCLFCLLGCSEKQGIPSSRYSTFPQTIELKAEVIQLDTALFRYPFRIAVRDSIAVVMDLHNADHFLHVFSYPQWAHITSFGKRGEAPGELLSAETFHFHALDSIWVLDANKMEINRWKISPDHRSSRCIEVISLDKKLVRILDFFPMDSCIWAPDYLGEFRCHQIDLAGKRVNSVGNIPSQKEYKEVARPALAQAWRSFMDYHPSTGRLVLATQLGEVIEIYDLKNNTHTAVYGPAGEPVFEMYQGGCIPTGIMGFSDIQVTEKYIYTVFHGQTFKEIAISYQKGKNPEDGGRFIYVFDLDGKPVCRYALDRAIYGIYVNEETGTITATDVNNDDSIVQFKIESIHQPGRL